MPLNNPPQSRVMMFSFRNHAEENIRESAEQALLEAAEIIRKRAEKIASRGMRGGAWVGMSEEPLHENIEKRLNRTGHYPTVEVGTHVKHGFFWEVGHHNLFLQNQWVRNDWLTQALAESMDRAVRKLRNIMRMKSRSQIPPAMFVGTRTFLYTAGKYLADLNAIFQSPVLRQYRGATLRTARLLGDVNAYQRGLIKHRLLRRGVGRMAGRSLLMRVKRGEVPVGRRIIRRFAGARMARVWSIRGLDHRQSPP